jgi:hypothetical protein
MPDIQDIMDITFNQLSLEQQLQLKEAIEQFQQKCLMSFSKNRSGVPFLKSKMPRVLMPGELDTTTAAEKQEVFGMVQQTLEDIMARHNTTFLNSFRQMMVGIFGPSVDKHFEGESSVAAASQPLRQDASVQPPPQSMSVQPLNTWIVNQFGRTLIKQYLIHVHMEKWRLALLEFNLPLLTG